MNNIKKLLLIISFLLINQLILPCTFINQNPTNPCVLLTNGKRGCFLLFCSSATILPDKWNRAVPCPCSKITNYKICNDFQLILRVPENRVEYHTSLEPNKSPVALTILPYFCETNTADADPDLINFPPEEEFFKTESEGFPGTASVLTSGEPKQQLECLEIGDSVLAYDVESQTFKETLVININKSSVYTELVKIFCQQDWISCAPDQKFYLVKDKKWTFAKDLKSGDQLYKRLADNSLGVTIVDQVLIEKENKQETVSITLEKYHNFCLGSGAIAHNCMYTVVAGTVVPLVWDLTTAMVSNLLNSAPQIPASLFPQKFIELELQKDLPNTKIVSRQAPKERISQHQQAFFGPNCSLAGADESKKNAQRVFNEVEYQYYQRNAQRLTLMAQLVWEPYSKMFSDMLNKVAKVVREKRNVILKQTKELYKSMVQKARERADGQKEKPVPELPVSQTSSNSPDPEECMRNNPNDLDQKILDEEFKKLQKQHAKSILEALEKVEKPLQQEALQRLSNLFDQLAKNKMLESMKNLSQNFKEGMLPIPLELLGKIVPEIGNLLAKAVRTEFYYMPSRGGPSNIYIMIKDLILPKLGLDLRAGDYIYSDTSHNGDHIEVFHGNNNQLKDSLKGTAKDVRNWNLTRHKDKKMQALNLEEIEGKCVRKTYGNARNINKFIESQSEKK